MTSQVKSRLVWLADILEKSERLSLGVSSRHTGAGAAAFSLLGQGGLKRASPDLRYVNKIEHWCVSEITAWGFVQKRKTEEELSLWPELASSRASSDQYAGLPSGHWRPQEGKQEWGFGARPRGRGGWVCWRNLEWGGCSCYLRDCCCSDSGPGLQNSAGSGRKAVSTSFLLSSSQLLSPKSCNSNFKSEKVSGQ